MPHPFRHQKGSVKWYARFHMVKPVCVLEGTRLGPYLGPLPPQSMPLPLPRPDSTQEALPLSIAGSARTLCQLGLLGALWVWAPLDVPVTEELTCPRHQQEPAPHGCLGDSAQTPENNRNYNRCLQHQGSIQREKNLAPVVQNSSGLKE